MTVEDLILGVFWTEIDKEDLDNVIKVLKAMVNAANVLIKTEDELDLKKSFTVANVVPAVIENLTEAKIIMDSLMTTEE